MLNVLYYVVYFQHSVGYKLCISVCWMYFHFAMKPLYPELLNSGIDTIIVLLSHTMLNCNLLKHQPRFGKGYIGISLSVCLHISRKCNSPIRDCLILMKLYTVVVYDLRMCIEKDSPGLKNIKGDTRGKLYVEDGSNLCDLTYSFSSIWLRLADGNQL